MSFYLMLLFSKPLLTFLLCDIILKMKFFKVSLKKSNLSVIILSNDFSCLFYFLNCSYLFFIINFFLEHLFLCFCSVTAYTDSHWTNFKVVSRIFCIENLMCLLHLQKLTEFFFNGFMNVL